MFLQNHSSRCVKDEHVRKQEDQQEATPIAQRGREGEEFKTDFGDRIIRIKRWIPYTWKKASKRHPGSVA